MDINQLINSLHPLEQAVLPHLSTCKSLKDLMQKTNMSDAEVMRALQWLENKNVLKITPIAKEIIKLDTNGVNYLKDSLPERRFLKAVENQPLKIPDISKESKLSQQEISVCLGVLKSKAAINMQQGQVEITDQGKSALSKEWLEDALLKKISTTQTSPDDLAPEEKFAFDAFKKRKNIIQISVIKDKNYELTNLGKQLTSSEIKIQPAAEKLTPEMLKDGSWKNKTFRRYDVNINVPKTTRGKRHFVNQAVDYIKRIWLDLGFQEMEGSILQTSFWDLDALFVPQDHPAREMQDTFYMKEPKFGKILDEQAYNNIKQTHENGWTTNSTGWKYKFNDELSKTNILRTHTTVLSARTISNLKSEDLPAKFFSVNKVFRNEALDQSHLFEFYQVEGIVIDPNVNFQNLLGYLKTFFKKMGYLDVRIRPAHFPYTEPSAEVDVLHPTFNKWIELGGAGIFRPEVVKPLLGIDVPVLAWGMGMGRIISEYYKLNDIRDLYKNDLLQLRNMRQWMR